MNLLNKVLGEDSTPDPESETLNETIARAASSWSADRDLPLIIAGLREQAARWSVEQAAGTRKRVTSKQIAVPKKTTDFLKNLKITL